MYSHLVKYIYNLIYYLKHVIFFFFFTWYHKVYHENLVDIIFFDDEIGQE